MHPPPDMGGAALPQHVAFVMDGNGRWANAQGLPRTEGHRRGVETVRTVLDTAREWGIRYVTLYAFSTENWRRPEQEIGILFDLLVEYIERELVRFEQNEARLRFVGDLDGLPPRAREAVERAMASTRRFDKFQAIVALNYGGRDELVRAARRWATDPQGVAPSELTESAFARYLDAPDVPDPDLMIRTSGEERISNYLLWQLAYAEFMFVPEAWPAFDAERFRAALEAFAKRRRRFGKTDQQLTESSP